jgi:hypothetical protein
MFSPRRERHTLLIPASAVSVDTPLTVIFIELEMHYEFSVIISAQKCEMMDFVLTQIDKGTRKECGRNIRVTTATHWAKIDHLRWWY